MKYKSLFTETPSPEVHKKELNRRIENIDKFSKPFEKLVHEAQTKYNVFWFCY